MKHLLQTYGGHYRALFFLGLPIVIGQLGVIVLGFADTLMIGHHSTPELAAASFVNNMFNLCIIFSTGFSYGLTPVVGGLYGNNRLAEAGQALRCSLAANVLVAFLQMAIMAVLYLNVEKLGQPEELIPLIKPYYLVLLASLPFVMLFNGFKQFTDGITDTQTAMWILLGGNALNIAGNYVLINGKLGLPEWGLLGAGVSTLVSRIVMVVVFALIVLRGRRFRRYRAGFFRRGWSSALFRQLNALGWPVGLQMGIGDGIVQSQHHYGGMVGYHCAGIAPDYAYHFTIHFHDVLWHGSCHSRACKQLPWAGRYGECTPFSLCRFSPHIVHGGGIAVHCFRITLPYGWLVYRKCRGGSHDTAPVLAVSYLPVWRRSSDMLCQCPAWHCRC